MPKTKSPVPLEPSKSIDPYNHFEVRKSPPPPLGSGPGQQPPPPPCGLWLCSWALGLKHALLELRSYLYTSRRRLTVDGRCSGVSLTGKRKKKVFRFPKKARRRSMCSTMVGGSWRLAVGGGWRLAVGNWRLVAVGGGWRRLVAGGWWLEAVGSGWQLAVGRRWRLAAVGGWRLVAVGGWRLVVGGWWRLAVDGSWRLAVGGPLGRSLRAVLSKKKKNLVP